MYRMESGAVGYISLMSLRVQLREAEKERLGALDYLFE
jgi:hypothetical protein